MSEGTPTLWGFERPPGGQLRSLPGRGPELRPSAQGSSGVASTLKGPPEVRREFGREVGREFGGFRLFSGI